ncbi:MAG: hypothetical protein PVS3B1_26070 [Ktedonobacteraceae bacterium]
MILYGLCEPIQKPKAEAQQVAEHVTFQVMDATLMLEFPDDYFDLVNMRMGSSFLRTWDWPKALSEMSRVTKGGGIIRVVDSQLGGTAESSPALTSFSTLLVNAFHQSGHLFEPSINGLIDHLQDLIHQHTNSDACQSRIIKIESHAGTPKGEQGYEDVKHLFQTIRPFLHKWGQDQNFEQITQQALVEMRRPDFVSTWNMIVVWATKQSGGQKRRHYQ